MSIVIVGGHDRMTPDYIKTCGKYNCKAKVFTQMETGLKDKIGNPDLVILLTNIVSHKLAKTAKKEADRKNIAIVRSHNSSVRSLDNMLNSIINN